MQTQSYMQELSLFNNIQSFFYYYSLEMTSIWVFFGFLFLFFCFFKSLLVACPTHTNPPGSGLGIGGILFHKHIDKSTQQMN